MKAWDWRQNWTGVGTGRGIWCHSVFLGLMMSSIDTEVYLTYKNGCFNFRFRSHSHVHFLDVLYSTSLSDSTKQMLFPSFYSTPSQIAVIARQKMQAHFAQFRGSRILLAFSTPPSLTHCMLTHHVLTPYCPHYQYSTSSSRVRQTHPPGLQDRPHRAPPRHRRHHRHHHQKRKTCLHPDLCHLRR
jgi:hypothetical protein